MRDGRSHVADGPPVTTWGSDRSAASKPIPMLRASLSTMLTRPGRGALSRPTQALWNRVARKSTTWRNHIQPTVGREQEQRSL